MRNLTRVFDAVAGGAFVVCQQMSRAFCACVDSTDGLYVSMALFMICLRCAAFSVRREFVSQIVSMRSLSVATPSLWQGAEV